MTLYKQKLAYILLRICIYPIGLLPISLIRRLGRGLGYLLFYCMKNYRKRTLSNLSLATSLQLDGTSLRKMAIRSFQNLAIVALEYPKFARMRDPSRWITCKNRDKIAGLLREGQGVIFFCGHQANWETLFLDGTKHMPGAAIGKQIKNPYLYKWILSIREQYGGKIIEQKRALKEGLHYLQQGAFLGILGDQADPESTFSFPFFGRKTKVSLAPALLSYKSKCPIAVATVKRTNKGYEILYSDPLWPDRSKPLKQEVFRLMKETLLVFEASVKKAPDEWLWQHNKYKQQNKRHILPRFRHESILFLFDEAHLTFFPELSTFRKIYPNAFFFIFLPKNAPKPDKTLDFEEVHFYEKPSELLLNDYRYKCVFNFTGFQAIKRHFSRKGAYEVLNYQDFVRLAPLQTEVATMFQNALSNPSNHKA